MANQFPPLHRLHNGTAPGPQNCVCLWLVPTTDSCFCLKLFWLHWVFIAAGGLFPVAACRLSCTSAWGSSFPDQGLNPHLWLGRQVLNHWATREVPPTPLLSFTLKLRRRQTLHSPELPEDTEVTCTRQEHHILRRIRTKCLYINPLVLQSRRVRYFEDETLGSAGKGKGVFLNWILNHLGPKILIWKHTRSVLTEPSGSFFTWVWKVEITQFATGS